MREQGNSSVAGCAGAQSALPRQTDAGSATPSGARIHEVIAELENRHGADWRSEMDAQAAGIAKPIRPAITTTWALAMELVDHLKQRSAR